MPDAEKIIARKIDKILRRNGFGGDYTQAELDGWGSEIASALRDAEVLTETEWEYTGKIGDTRRFTEDPEVVKRWAKRGGYNIRRRTKAVHPGPWEPVEGEPT